MDIFSGWLSSDNFMPHGVCFMWDSFLLWSIVISDALIAVSYYSIPIALLYFLYRKKNFEYKLLLLLFSLFILACGTTHLISIINIWKPFYWLESVAKGLTALVSVLTAVLLWPLIPKVLALPTTGQLLDANRALNHEIVERKKTERLLRENEISLQQVAMVFEATSEGIFVTDKGNRIIRSNGALTKILGYSHDELKNKHPKIFMSGMHDEKFYDAMKNALNNEGSWRGEITNRHKNGDLIPLLLTINKLENERGDFFGYSGVYADIREQKQVQAELKRANDAKSIFMSKMSHELRTPMNAILGFAQIMQMDEELTEDQLENINEIRGAGKHLMALIDEILDLSRIETQQIALEFTSIDIVALLDSCRSLISPMLKEYNVELNARECPNEVKAYADINRLKQVMINLISNAIKYNKAGGRVDIQAKKISEAQLLITVADTGIGLSEQQMEKLFEPFNRLGRESSDIEGNGIGLSICDHLVRLMNGKMEVESRVDEGSCFKLYLPLSRE